jgi:hypothetical protein
MKVFPPSLTYILLTLSFFPQGVMAYGSSPDELRDHEIEARRIEEVRDRHRQVIANVKRGVIDSGGSPAIEADLAALQEDLRLLETAGIVNPENLEMFRGKDSPFIGVVYLDVHIFSMSYQKAEERDQAFETLSDKLAMAEESPDRYITFVNTGEQNPVWSVVSVSADTTLVSRPIYK